MDLDENFVSSNSLPTQTQPSKIEILIRGSGYEYYYFVGSIALIWPTFFLRMIGEKYRHTLQCQNYKYNISNNVN